MVGVIVAAGICAVLFIVIPSLVVLLRLTGHRNPENFDENPGAMDGTPYEPWRGEILARIRTVRQAAAEEVSLRAADGVTLKARWIPGGPRTALLIHGYNSTPLNNFAPLASALLAEGWSVLMPFTRGHGESGGRVTFGLREAEDVRRWAEWVCERAECGSLMVYGISLGAAAVNFASAGPWPAGVRVLVSEAGYTCVRKQMREMPGMSALLGRVLTPWMVFFARPVLGSDFREDGQARLRMARKPMCFLTGTRDETVLPETVEQAYEACGAEKMLLKAENAPHTLAFLAGGETVRKELLAFINHWMETGGEEK